MAKYVQLAFEFDDDTVYVTGYEELGRGARIPVKKVSATDPSRATATTEAVDLLYDEGPPIP